MKATIDLDKYVSSIWYTVVSVLVFALALLNVFEVTNIHWLLFVAVALFNIISYLFRQSFTLEFSFKKAQR